MKSLVRLKRLGAALIVPLLLFIILICASCSTAPDKGAAAGAGSGFYLVKGNRSSYINNVRFDRYARRIQSVLSDYGMVPVRYGNADTIILVEYGRKTFTDTSLELRPRYDIRSNTTRWVHEKPVPVESAYLTLTALEAEAYRDTGAKIPLWNISVRRQAGGVQFHNAFPELLDLLRARLE